MQHHAFVIPAEVEEGIAHAEMWISQNLKLQTKNNPDVVVLRYGLFSVDDAREVVRFASQAPIVGEKKAVIIAASRAYQEAQNALLKLFEEPPQNTYLFLVLPTLGMLLPTLKSRVSVLKHETRSTKNQTKIPEAVAEFLKANKEKRSAMIKRLVSGKDEDERRENRDTAITILNGVEIAARNYGLTMSIIPLLEDIQELRGHLQDRAAPVRMILEHLSLVLPKELK